MQAVTTGGQLAVGHICDSLFCTAAFAPLILGVSASSVAMGALIVLAARCWTAFAGPRWRSRRAIVVITLLLQCLQTSFDITRLVLVFATHFGDFGYFLRPRWEDAAAPVVGVLLQLQSQFFLLCRAFQYASMARVSPRVKWAVTALVGFAILGGSAMGMGVALEIYLLGWFLYLVPGSPHSPLYNKMVLIWLYTGAVVDLLLVTAIVHELLRAKRVSQGDVRGRKTLKVIRRMISVLLDGGVVLVVAQVGTAIAWQVATYNHTHFEGSAVYSAILCLPKIYTLTYYGMLLSVAEPPPAPTSRRSSFHLRDPVGMNVVETVEYNWGKAKTSGSSPSSNEGVITVTGLPLDAFPYAVQQTYHPPFPEPDEDGSTRSINTGHRRRTSVHGYHTPPSSPTPFLGISNRPVARPSYPPAPPMALPRSSPRPFKSRSPSRSRSPPGSPLRSTFKLPRSEVPDDVIAEESEEGHDETQLKDTGSHFMLQILGEAKDEHDCEDERTLASYRFGSERAGSSFIDLSTASPVPSSTSTAFSRGSDSDYSAPRKGSTATSKSRSAGQDGSRKDSDASSWACVDAKSLGQSQLARS